MGALMGFTANAANAALIDVTIAGGYRINMPVGIFSGAGFLALETISLIFGIDDTTTDTDGSAKADVTASLTVSTRRYRPLGSR